MTPPLVCGNSCVLFVCTLSMTGKSTLYKRRGHFILSIKNLSDFIFPIRMKAYGLFYFWRIYELFHRFYRYKFVGEIHLDKSRLISISSLCNTSKTDFSTAADADNLKLRHIQFQVVSTKRKICALTITAQMLPFVFSSHR